MEQDCQRPKARLSGEQGGTLLLCFECGRRQNLQHKGLDRLRCHHFLHVMDKFSAGGVMVF